LSRRTSSLGHPSLLRVEHLAAEVPSPEGGRAPALRGVDFALHAGESVGLVGESGSGKSLTALALLGLLPEQVRITSGRILLEGQDLLQLSEADMRRIRGARIAIVFQEPMTALNPVLSIGYQVGEAIRLHRKLGRAAVRRRVGELLEQVAMPAPAEVLDAYPHQLSGGQRQRVLLAMALAAEPEVLIADEPTTALDVTVQAQILELLDALATALDLAILLITHDLGLVAGHCDRVLVMYAGQVVEDSPVDALFDNPAHPYTRALLQVTPRLGQRIERGRLPSIPGDVPDPAALPAGCAFHPRCPEAFERCTRELPAPYRIAEAGKVRCFLWDDDLATQGR
jgi:peptide/nickel transport system ATP-binding protein